MIATGASEPRKMHISLYEALGGGGGIEGREALDRKEPRVFRKLKNKWHIDKLTIFASFPVFSIPSKICDILHDSKEFHMQLPIKMRAFPSSIGSNNGGCCNHFLRQK